jgi:flavin reductase (DIM6/NTAB) family NADH-FMN oxidoreductase RutF
MRERNRACRLHRDCAGFPLPFAALARHLPERSSSTLAGLTQAGAFAVNILAAQHGPLASRFAGRDGVEGDVRFEEGDWFPLVTGAPVLVDALAWFDCGVEEILERHTHAIVIGTVQAVCVGGKKSGLLHWRSRFETLE